MAGSGGAPLHSHPRAHLHVLGEEEVHLPEEQGALDVNDLGRIVWRRFGRDPARVKPPMMSFQTRKESDIIGLGCNRNFVPV